MVFTAVAGHNADALCGSIERVLARLCPVATVGDGILAASGERPEVMLWHSHGDMTLRAERSILVFGEPTAHACCIEVPPECVVIAGVEDEAAAGYAARRGLRLLDCGLSSKASLTFSSIGSESGVISLQRTVTGLAGVAVEPFELPVRFEPKPYFPLLAAVGIMLLGGMSARL